MAEADEQMYLFNWVAFARSTIPEVDLLFHVPNGGSRDRREAARLKAQRERAAEYDVNDYVDESIRKSIKKRRGRNV